MKKAIVFFCAAALFGALLPGCGTGRELNSLALVMGVAIDKGAGKNEYEVTAQLAQTPTSVSDSEGTGAPNDGAYENLTKIGVGVAAAMQEISRVQSRALYTGHIQLVVISREVAEEGIEPILNYFIGSADGRLSTLLLIAENDAKELLESKSAAAKSPAAGLAELIETRVKAGELTRPSMLSFLNDMLDGLTASMLPVVSTKKDKNDNDIIQITGAAAFDGAVLSEVMPLKIAQAILTLRDKTGGGYLTVQTDGGYMTLRVKKASSRVRTEIMDGTPKIKVTVNREYLVDDSTLELDFSNENSRAEAEAFAKEELSRLLNNALRWAKRYKLDVFAFGEQLRRYHRHESEPWLEDWRGFFPELDVELEINVKILGTGATIKGLEPAERQGENK